MGDERDYGDSISTKLTYFLVGAGIGAVLALLFAPKSGEELRSDIADATRKGIDKSKEAIDYLNRTSTSQFFKDILEALQVNGARLCRRRGHHGLRTGLAHGCDRAQLGARSRRRR